MKVDEMAVLHLACPPGNAAIRPTQRLAQCTLAFVQCQTTCAFPSAGHPQDYSPALVRLNEPFEIRHATSPEPLIRKSRHPTINQIEAYVTIAYRGGGLRLLLLLLGPLRTMDSLWPSCAPGLYGGKVADLSEDRSQL